jgi:hypothetical protein
MSGALYDYVSGSGVIVPDTGSILGTVQNEFQGVFGAGLNVDSSTPQGVLISAETSARSTVVDNNSTLANQINPNQAGGIFLDAICALSGLERSAETYTVVDGAILTGVQSTPIPAGSLVETAAGDQFQLSNTVTLDSITGSATGNFIAVEGGPVPCGAGTLGLTTVVSGVFGWETVSNVTQGTIGTSEQSDVALRALRNATLFLQGVSLIGASDSALVNLPGVIGVQQLENVSSSGTIISGVSLLANSVWFCVDGGTAQDIGSVLLQNKSYGSNWNGAQSIALVEPSSGQTYTVHWDVPTLVPLLVQVTVAQGTYNGSVVSGVTQAVLDFGANQIAPADPNAQPVQGFYVGNNASPFEIAAGIVQECPGVIISNLELSLASAPSLQPAQIAMNINQKPTISVGNISVILVS